jgi:NAD(P)-dependent dehydrogenase (short-subunit alcohol dehydrogenase family)
MSTSAEGKRTALITGANSGLGKAITAAMAAEDMRVGLLVRDRARGEAALKKTRAAKGNDDLHLFVAGRPVTDPRPGAGGA